jgi:hypothetical protein
MTESNLHYNEMTDLYMEMLKGAQKEADRELAALLRHRIKSMSTPPSTTDDGCQIFPFPPLAVQCQEMTAVVDEGCFWKTQVFWTDLIQFLAFFGFSVAAFLNFIYMLAKLGWCLPS